MRDAAIVAIVGDLHCGSKYGLCPPRVMLDNAGEYVASDQQRQVYKRWLSFWRRVRELKESTGFSVVCVINGEVADINRHSATDPISHNPADVLKLSIDVLSDPLSVSEHIIVIRGTEAHSGVDSHRDEIVARDIEAIEDKENKTFSWNRFRGIIGGVQFDIAHHPESNARLPWTIGSNAGRIASIVQSQYVRRRQRPPDLVIRGHVHVSADSYDNQYPTRAIVVPSWKLPDPFVYKIAGDEVQIGGIIVVCERGEYDVQKVISDRKEKYIIWRPEKK